MSQTTLTSYYNSRKRPASEDIINSKSKIAHTDDVHAKAQHKSPIIQDEFVCPSSKLSAINVKKQKQQEKRTEPSSSLTAARKELSLGDLRKRWAGSSRLAELKASADRISKDIQDFKESSLKKNLEEFKSINVEVPASPSKKSLIHNLLLSPKKESQPANHERPLISPRKVFVSPVKSPNKVPSYIRLASLATSSNSLTLPHRYRSLAEMFRGMETVVALLYNRNEKITFAKLKPSVQEMLKKNFSEKHLSQLKHLVPDFYTFEIQKNKNFSSSSNKETYDLVITPNFPNDIKVMNPTVLLERRRYFYDTLLQLTKKYHAQFLLTLDLPLVIPDEKLTRWHPEFELEKVPDVEMAKLPQTPNTEKLSTAQDVLSKARELFKCNTKMERALEKLAQSKSGQEEIKTINGITENKQNAVTPSTTQSSANSVTILNPALQNLPASLLEKVKAKQAAKALQAMTRSSEDEQKYMIYCRLPDLARTLRNIFVTERKNVLALNIILSKLDSSFKSVSSNDLQRDINKLTEEASEWIKLHNIRNISYLKLDRNADMKKIITKLEALANKYKHD